MSYDNLYIALAMTQEKSATDVGRPARGGLQKKTEADPLGPIAAFCSGSNVAPRWWRVQSVAPNVALS